MHIKKHFIKSGNTLLDYKDINNFTTIKDYCNRNKSRNQLSEIDKAVLLIFDSPYLSHNIS